MFRYMFEILTTLLESLRNQKTHLRLDLGKTSYKELVFARGEFLRLVGAQNQSLRLIIIYFILKYTFTIKITLLESLQIKKTQLKVQFRQN